MGDMLVDKLLKLPEFEVTNIHQNDYDMGIYVETKDRPNYCPVCVFATQILVIYKSRQQIIRDLNIHNQRVSLFVKKRYYRCKECSGCFAEPLYCVDGKNRMTVRLRNHIAEKAKITPFSTLENDLKISHTTIRKIFLEEVDLQSLQKPNNVEVVTMDMWSGYRNAVYETLPNAIVVIDKFHIVKMLTEQLDNMRRRYSRLGPAELKRNRAIFLMREDKLTPYARDLRQQWFNEYPKLETACRLTENFYKIYDSPNRQEAEERYLDWKKSIPYNDSEFNGYSMITSTIRRCEKEVFNYFDAPETNAFVEGLNSVIRGIATQGRGYDFDVLRGKVLFTAGRRCEMPPVDYHWTSMMYKIELPKITDYGIPFESFWMPFRVDATRYKNVASTTKLREPNFPAFFLFP